MPLSPNIIILLEALQGEFDLISDERKASLHRLSQFIQEKKNADLPVRIVVVCTHNSRRSHLGQAWATAWGAYYGIATEAFSGGTEATACHPNTIAALTAQGWQIDTETPPPNPRYAALAGPDMAPIHFWSKRFDDAANPQEGFAAIMVCSEADAACPFVPGAELRISLPFADPKTADGTDRATETYQERSADIARELGYAFFSSL